MKRLLPARVPSVRPVRLAWLACAALIAACATAPIAPPPKPEAPVVTYERKLGWMLRLEDHRVLRDTAAPATAPAPSVRSAGIAAPPVADLIALLADADPRVRRRAALAIGRVGLKAGVRPLEAALAADREPEVRQMAAFSLGLLRDLSAVPALRSALGDEMPIVQGRAAEALGVLGDTASRQLIAGLVASIVAAGEVAAIAPDDVDETHAPAVEAFRLGVLALGRLKDYEALASAVLDQKSVPRVTWWPVAAAFQRVEDRRAAYVLMAFARGEGRFGRAFAARGLGALKDPVAVDALVPLAKEWARDTGTAVAAVKALGSIGDRRAGPVLIDLLRTKGLDPLLRLEVIGALASTRAAGAFDLLLPLAEDPVSAVRAAVFTGLREIDPLSYTVMLSGLDPDPDWRVRSAIASSLSVLERDAAEPRLRAMLKDSDLRVIPAVLSALVTIKAERLGPLLLQWLTHQDVVIRSAAASGIGEVKPAGGDRALLDAFHAASRDDAYGARTAALDALVKYGPEVASPALREALADKDWAVRVHAAALLAPIEPSADLAAAIRPAPTGREPSFYDERELTTPTVSPRIYIDTSRGRIELEMAVVDAPLTCLAFMTLARKGFYNGVHWHRVVPNFVVQAGDPRGDGEGGPGFTIRDEINQLPYRRGTVGMALEWADTGGSQFFLTHSPQPHLDGRYTVFGQIVRGLDVLDRIQPDDIIVRVLVWDGKTMSSVQ
jgi:cyclophilin family peptidyl-prolyl cis-trans isomerase/HEAT repeat protein